MMLSTEEKIQQWKNDANRQSFIKNYKQWDVWLHIDELSLVVYKFEISPNKWLVAIEYKSRFSGSSSDWNPGVFYYIHNPEHPFQPHRKQVHELMTCLKDEKMRLLAEKRAEAGK